MIPVLIPHTLATITTMAAKGIAKATPAKLELPKVVAKVAEIKLIPVEPVDTFDNLF